MIVYKSIFLTKAQNELLNAWQWYEEKQIGLGDKFKKEVYNCLNKITKNPVVYPLRNELFRERKINIFPYLIIYHFSVETNLIIVTSIFHTSRNPKKKYKD